MCQVEIMMVTYPSGKRIYLGPVFPEIYLTLREAEIILLLEGNTYIQIAMKLGISKRTVELYINNVRKKLNCSSKNKLILLMNNYNIIDQLKEIIDSDVDPTTRLL